MTAAIHPGKTLRWKEAGKHISATPCAYFGPKAVLTDNQGRYWIASPKSDARVEIAAGPFTIEDALEAAIRHILGHPMPGEEIKMAVGLAALAALHEKESAAP